MSPTSIFDAVRDNGEPPEAVAVVADGVAWSYGTLLRAARGFAARLDRWRMPYAPVVADVTDPVASAVITLGCDLAGVPVVHQDPDSPHPRRGHRVHDGRRSAPAVADSPCGVPGLWLSDAEPAALPAEVPPGSQIFLTSGSTGPPVAVVRTAEAILADACRVASRLGYAPGASVVSAAPPFHAYGFNYGLVAPLITGTLVRQCPARSLPSQLARAVAEHQARTLIALPFHYRLMAGDQQPARQGAKVDFGGLRQAVSAGAPLAPDVAARIAERRAFTLYNCYGSSEAGAVTLLPMTGQEAPGEIGEPLPGVTASIALPPGATRSPRPDPDTPGELLLRTGSLAVGRIGRSGFEVLTDQDGWYHTGDLAVWTPTRRAIRLTGRVGAVINVAGEKVNPSEVEGILAEHPAVVEAQVLAAADAARGQVPVARLVLREPVPTEQLTVWCRDRMAPHQVPRQIEVVRALPRSATGKPIIGPIPEEFR